MSLIYTFKTLKIISKLCALSSIIFLFCVQNSFSESKSEFQLSSVNVIEGTPIQISSDSAIYNENQGFATFSGDVRVGHGPYKLRGENVKVIFDITVEGNKEPLEMIFTESVIFSNGFEIGKSEKANYYIVEKLLIMNIDVMFKQNESVFFGESAEFDLANGNMSFGGRINASIGSGG